MPRIKKIKPDRDIIAAIITAGMLTQKANIPFYKSERDKFIKNAVSLTDELIKALGRKEK